MQVSTAKTEQSESSVRPTVSKHVSEDERPFAYWKGRVIEVCSPSRYMEIRIFRDYGEKQCLGSSLEFAVEMLHGSGNSIDNKTAKQVQERFWNSLPVSASFTTHEACSECRTNVEKFTTSYLQARDLVLVNEPQIFVNIQDVQTPLLPDFLGLSEAAVLLTLAGYK